ncbi:selenide, water dikinase SelD [candidate division KSB1 bacterium]|nr:selenide, water dikinase SelD [candidate division KSB1 bacterium]
MEIIYLDHNATTPIAPEVADAMLPYLKEHFGNPSSYHYYGQQTKKAIQKARAEVAGLLDCKTDEVIFTSGGSESNNLAIKGAAEQLRDRGNHIITSQIEHPAVINVCEYLKKHGYFITYIPVDANGLIDPADVEKAILPETILITIMHANNEVGTIQPIAEISEIARRNDILLHTDAAQSVGKISTKVNELGVDLLSVAGHKLYGPKGIGALYIRRGIALSKQIHGADHEQNLRAGTENVLEIVGLGKACALAKESLSENIEHSRLLRDRLWNGLKDSLPEIRLNGHPEKRLPNTLSISFPGIDVNTLLDELNGIAASPGAACHTDVAEPSAVMQAMRVPVEAALGTVRFSTGRTNNEQQIDKAIEQIVTAVNNLKQDSSSETIADATSDIKLTHFTHGLGCACKLRPQNLEKVLASLPQISHPNVIVGSTTADDAAVYKINENFAIVQTVDFFTPIVDDPYHFGAIAAANALSDIYAMGGTPLFALNIVGFPEKRLPLEVLQSILKGAHDKTQEAGTPILGGHTVEDTEPKYGLVVTGSIDPKKVITNSNARPGDMLILTKPIGLGIITTALKRGLTDASTEQEAIRIMSTLNRNAAAAMMEVAGVHACTDITGFGLLGHLHEMTFSSEVNATIYLDKIPLLQQAYDLAAADVIPGGTIANKDHVSKWTEFDPKIPELAKLLLSDAQTSGGLLISVKGENKEELLSALKTHSVKVVAQIGEMTEKGDGTIRVKP